MRGNTVLWALYPCQYLFGTDNPQCWSTVPDVIGWNDAGCEKDEGYQLLGKVKDIRERGVLDGYDPSTSPEAPLPQTEREIIIDVEKIVDFSRAPYRRRRDIMWPSYGLFHLLSVPEATMIEVESSAFGDGEEIPERYTGDGQNVSPPLSWCRVPEGTKEFAIICEDPDAPTDKPWVHWVVWGIPKTTISLPKGSSGTGTVGKNTAGGTRYMGPMPPEGHGRHHYHFKVYALEEGIQLAPGSEKEDLCDRMKGHILDEGELVGVYER